MVTELIDPALYETLFPEGINRYAVGGLLVGLGAVVVYLGTGIAAGASTFLESVHGLGDRRRLERRDVDASSSETARRFSL